MSAGSNIINGEKIDWNNYYKNKSNLVPREMVLKALEFFEKENKTNKIKTANDVGSGHGCDTLELLKRGWKVTAIDYQDEGLKILNESILPEWKGNLKTVRNNFENIKLTRCNLLNASYSIPFCQPECFKAFWNKIVNSIIRGGRFAGNFFGERDEWAGNKKMTFLTKSEVEKLFKSFKIEYFDERDEDGQTADGTKKHWHVFSVIAKKQVE